MTNVTTIGQFAAELVASGTTVQKSQGPGKGTATTAIADFANEIMKKMKGVMTIQQVRPPKPLSLQWSILCNTGYPVTSESGRKTQFTGLSSIILSETDPERLDRRKTLLRHQTAGDVRFLVWLDINLWLSWNNAGIQRRSFEYWDKLPDYTSDLDLPYSGEKATRMSELVKEDIKCLNSLGDYLSTCAALVNNRDAPQPHRVISEEVKSAIDMILQVNNLQQT